MTARVSLKRAGKFLFPTRRQVVGGALSTVALAVLALASWSGVTGEPRSVKSASVPLRFEGQLPTLGGAVQWLNSPPLTSAGLRGKVVLVDFWTYTCVNWRRTLPYIRAWAEKYKSQGLVVIGVHTPEFSFERDPNNVREFTQEFGIEYPVAVDTRYGVWNSFNNQYWPALYLADAQGHIRYHQFGEGAYRETELAIQQLLEAAGHTDFDRNLVAINPQGAETAADWRELKSPETYVGYDLARGFASPAGTAADEAQTYIAPARLGLNEWALSGNWTVGKEAAVSNSSHGRVVFHFHGRDVNLVMAPPKDRSLSFRVLIDGQPPGAWHGVDVDEQGNGTLDKPRMYQLIRALPVSDRQVEIEFTDSGAAVFDFTFG